jgi:hypothetical protein
VNNKNDTSNNKMMSNNNMTLNNNIMTNDNMMKINDNIMSNNNKVINNNNIMDNNMIINNNQFYNYDPYYPFLDFLINGCNISQNELDLNGNHIYNHDFEKFTGPMGYIKKYNSEKGWIGIGLRVMNLFDNGNNDWIGNSHKQGEWYVCYHGTRTKESVLGIINNGFRKGPNQVENLVVNNNPLTKKDYPQIGFGVYFTPDIKVAKSYTKIIEYKNNKYRVVFMCRVNPYKVRISGSGFLTENWIVNGDDLNISFGNKRIDEVRPYRILIFREI